MEAKQKRYKVDSILAIPAMSVPDERIFSTLGNMITNKKSLEKS